MEKKISVVIATYRRADLLITCLKALSRQQFPQDDFEIVVVSDGPDHDTRAMLLELRHLTLPFVQYVTLPQNSGPAAARNSGWKKSTGKLVAFTDDDCIPQPAWLSEIWNAYTVHGMPEYIAFGGRIEVPLSVQPTDFERNTSFLESAEFVTANCCCTRAALQLFNGFDERFKAPWREDSDLQFKLIEHQIPIHRLDAALVVHPVRKAPWGVSIKEQKKTMFNALLYKKYPRLFRKKIQSRPAWNYYVIVTAFGVMISGLIIGNKVLFITGLSVHAVFTGSFVIKRLRQTSKAYSHVAEMLVTSLVIPFLSIYWTLYGSFRYKVLYY